MPTRTRLNTAAASPTPAAPPAPAEAAPPAGFGFTDSAHYLRATQGNDGFLGLMGWFSPIGAPPDTKISGRIFAGGREHSFPCCLPRIDVVEWNNRLLLNCGFNVTLPLPGGLQGQPTLPIIFYAGDRPIGRMDPTVTFPEAVVAEKAAQLTPLRVKKLHNLILSERERLSHAPQVSALPVVGQIDPCFACQLQCPHCASHVIRQDRYTMPIMTVPQIERILHNYGDCLIRIWLSLWGEPLLNKRLPELIERCKRHDIWVMISTNLSVPMRHDAAEALVRSGIDSLTLSIDGASQAVYEKYRVGGDLALVLANIRLLAETKRRLGSATPYLYWRYLEFPWNGHEIEAARALAAEAGCDDFGVERGITSHPARAGLHMHQPDTVSHAPDPKTAELWRELASRKREKREYFGCDYLYHSISINANGEVHPCCYVVAPYDTTGNAAEPVDTVRNSVVLRDARRMFGAISAGEVAGMAARDPCVTCKVVQVTKGHVFAQANFLQLFEHLTGRKPMNR